MATDTVPGAKPENADKLARGCWAEHADGSMIYVVDKDENDRIIFMMYDLNLDPPQFWTHAMALKEFEKQFTFDPKGKIPLSDVRWTWHDKTPMPWERVMKVIKSPTPQMSVTDALSAAARLAKSLQARMGKLDEEHVEALSGQGSERAKASAISVFDKIRRAIHELTADPE